MSNYCTNCGTKKEADAIFCTECGTKFEEEGDFQNQSREEEINSFEKQIAYESKESGTTDNIVYIPPKYNTAPQNHIIKKHSRKKRVLLPVITIAITLMMILASFLFIFNSDSDDSGDNYEISALIKEHGPKLSLHSLSGGSVNSIPQEGYIATYGLYDESGIFGVPGLRIGEIVEKNHGETMFQGEECILVKINGELSLPIKELMGSYYETSSYLSTDSQSEDLIDMIPDELPLYITSNYYVNKDDNTPVYMDYKIDFTEFMQIMYDLSKIVGYEDEMSSMISDEPVYMSLIIDWDIDNSMADMSFNIEGIPMLNMEGEFSVEFSEDYWDMTPEIEDLYVGFKKIIEFTMTLEINDFNFDMDYGSYDEESVYDLNEPEPYIDEYYEDDIFEDYSQTITTTMEITVINKEQVSVPAGTFEDCFVIDVKQREHYDYDDDDYYISNSYSSTSSTKIWVNEFGVMPKAEYSLFGGTEFGMGSSSDKFVIKLENYEN